jgi:glycosyltransferase involved in cell wall biosynthesis
VRCLSVSTEPLVTIILLSYNQEDFVCEALDSVLAQEYQNLEIIVSDDCSTDNSFALLEDRISRYSGFHEIHLRQNPVNMGITGHITAAASLAKGDLIIIAAGDDISRPNRAAVLVGAWLSAGARTTVIYSSYSGITPTGDPVPQGIGKIYSGPHLMSDMTDGLVQVHGATSAFTKDLIVDFPPMLPSARFEDRILPFRALLKGGSILFVDLPLVDYRLQVGVSQQRARDQRSYLNEHSQREEEVRLSDAIQRLYDLMTVSPENRSLRRRCERTIMTHEMRISAAIGKKGYERTLFENFLSGGEPLVALKLYIKHRFYIVAKYFVKI